MENITPPPAQQAQNTEKPTIHRNASWGVILSIFIILVMVVVGAFYAWGQRVSEEQSASTIVQ